MTLTLNNNTDIENIDLNAFIHSVEGLSKAIEEQDKEMKENDEKLRSIQTASKKSSALLEGLQGLFGVSNVNIQHAETEGLIINICIESCPTKLVLDNSNKLTDIQFTDNKFALDAKTILAEASKLPPPNDIRQAVLFISAAQNSKNLLKQHIVEQRKRRLIKMKADDVLEITLQNGMAFKLRIHPCYPMIPGGVYVDGITWSSDNHQVHDPCLLMSVQTSCNTQCFFTLDQLCAYVDHNYGSV